MGVVIDGQEYDVTRHRRPGEDILFAWSSTDNLHASKTTSVLTGKFRLVRFGTTLTLLFDIGDGWQVMTNTAVPADPAQVRLGNGSVGASMGFSTFFDNFHINSGVTTLMP